MAMRGELIKLHHRLSATMIYVTHDQTEAMTMGDRIVVMNEGRIQQIGTPLGVYDNPDNRFVAGFIGSPTMNLIDGVIEPGDGALVFRSGELTLRLPPAHAAVQVRAVTLGIRPEFLTLGTESDGVEMDCRVEAVEHLGAETILELSSSRAASHRQDNPQRCDPLRRCDQARDRSGEGARVRRRIRRAFARLSAPIHRSAARGP